MAGSVSDKYNLKDELEHGIFVGMLARSIAKEMNLDEEMQNKMAITGLLHDIGKMRLANYMNEDVLDIEEMKHARMHPTISYQIVKQYGYPEDIQQFIRWHHENYDGSGYPDNLEGWHIPIEACILRVCDFFCSLVSDRPYRKAFSGEAAMEMMIEEIKKFDIKVFLAFQRIVHADDKGTITLPEVNEEVRGVWKTVWN